MLLKIAELFDDRVVAIDDQPFPHRLRICFRSKWANLNVDQFVLRVSVLGDRVASSAQRAREQVGIVFVCPRYSRDLHNERAAGSNRRRCRLRGVR